MNTLAIARSIAATGLPRESAEAIADAIATRDDAAATKADLASLRDELKVDIAELRAELSELRAELKADIADLRAEVKTDIASKTNKILMLIIAGIIAQQFLPGLLRQAG